MSDKYFSGGILPGAADVQQRKQRKLLSARADYELMGRDFKGKDCRVHVVNRNDGTSWKPVVFTDSEALYFLNHADLTAHLESRKTGPVVHIYGPKA
mgnify:CR=1 FL=1